MKKMQCDVCGSTSIKKNSDGVFECQNCGVQYDPEEAKKLLTEITGTVKIDRSEELVNNLKRAKQYEEQNDTYNARAYYNKVLDMDADNKEAQEGIARLNEIREFKGNYIVEAKVDPKANVRRFLEELAENKSIVCDIYKEIAIKSVTERYYPFYFLKCNAIYEWSAVACTEYYENETVYEERYNSNTKRYEKTPVTKKVKKVQRVPRRGNTVHETSMLTYASERLKKEFPASDAADSLRFDFEELQGGRYGSYDVKSLEPKDLDATENGKAYKGYEVDLETDVSVLSKARDRVYDKNKSEAKDKIDRDIGGDYHEDLSGTSRVQRSTDVTVFIPLQIIEYTYKGESYVAICDLVTPIEQIPATYPADTELSNTKASLSQEKSSMESESTTLSCMTIGGFIVGLLVLLFGLFIEWGGAITFGVGCMIVAVILFVIALVHNNSRKKALDERAEEATKNIFAPRQKSLDAGKEAFFREYTDYASAQSAASGADCLEIKQYFAAVNLENDEEEDFAFNAGADNDEDDENHEEDNGDSSGGSNAKTESQNKKYPPLTEDDETITVLRGRIESLKKKRHLNWIYIPVGIAMLILGIIFLEEFDSSYTMLALSILMIIGGFIGAIALSIVGFGNANAEINRLFFMIGAHRDRWFQNNPGKTSPKGVRAGDIELKVAEIKNGKKGLSKKHKTVIIASVIVIALFVVAGIIESVVVNSMGNPYSEYLEGKTYTATERVNSLGYTKKTEITFYDGGIYRLIEIRNYYDNSKETEFKAEEGKYKIFYNMKDEGYTLEAGYYSFDVEVIGSNGVGHLKRMDVYFREDANAKGYDGYMAEINGEVPETDSQETAPEKETGAETNAPVKPQHATGTYSYENLLACWNNTLSGRNERELCGQSPFKGKEDGEWYWTGFNEGSPNYRYTVYETNAVVNEIDFSIRPDPNIISSGFENEILIRMRSILDIGLSFLSESDKEAVKTQLLNGENEATNGSFECTYEMNGWKYKAYYFTALDNDDYIGVKIIRTEG